eukprot:superscaffoldBa00013452_g26018
MSVNLSSNSFSSLHPLHFKCFWYSDVNITFAALQVTNILLLLPLSILILYLGFHQRRVKTASHSDFFTYHMVAMEIIGIFGSGGFCCGLCMDSLRVMTLGFYVCAIILPGHSHLHILTCVERYLAVVHPITYLGLRMEGGVRIRNITLGCVWLLCFGWVGLIILFRPEFPIIPFFCLFAVTLIVVCFCSLSVLCALRQPGPGGVGGDSQSKQRAFHTIIAIMGVLLFKFGGLLVFTGISLGSNQCMFLTSAFWLCVPSSLVLPLLFLNRAGKLTCCRNKTNSG